MTLKKQGLAFVSTLAIVALLLVASPAFAMGGGGWGGSDDGGDVDVHNFNGAWVENDVSVSADTGGNDANGGNGDRGGNGGDGGYGRRGGEGGNGGSGGDGGDGGVIFTGNADAYSYISNNVNSNRTDIEGCGCDADSDTLGGRRGQRGGSDEGDVEVHNLNLAYVGNNVDVDADTGNNDADGGSGDRGGNGGDGGDSERSRHHRHHGRGGAGGDAGNGGAGGDGGWGGLVDTGDAWAGSEIFNVVNRNVTRTSR